MEKSYYGCLQKSNIKVLLKWTFKLLWKKSYSISVICYLAKVSITQQYLFFLFNSSHVVNHVYRKKTSLLVSRQMMVSRNNPLGKIIPSFSLKYVLIHLLYSQSVCRPPANISNKQCTEKNTELWKLDVICVWKEYSNIFFSVLMLSHFICSCGICCGFIFWHQPVMYVLPCCMLREKTQHGNITFAAHFMG